MAQQKLATFPLSLTKITFPRERKTSSQVMRSAKVSWATQCKASYNVHSQTIFRRSANYQPSIWTFDYIQSLNTEYKEEIYTQRVRVLREEVRMLLCKVESELDQLEFTDALQRLGVDYHYDHEIRKFLDDIFKMNTLNEENDLYATTLKFRLLRQHGYNISSDVFIRFKDDKGNLKKDHTLDVKGMLSLYEASFHSFEDETILDEAKDFTSKFLKEYWTEEKGNNYTSLLINHALELPLHWRNPRWETQWFINVYERKENMIPTLLQLAKLNFNIAQAIYLEELKESSRWWKRVGLGEKCSFARDRLVENYVWTVGANSHPDLEYYRKSMTKINSLITIIDDIYDVYGTFEELKLFTEVIGSWDLNAMDSLPNYMKTCFQALNNIVNEIACENQEKNGYNITAYLIKTWADLCKSYFIEAKWYYSEYMPSLEEYLGNAWISISTPLQLIHTYFLIPHSINMEELNNMEKYSDIIQFSAMISRLANDLGTYKRENEMGDVAKSIQCYMNESGASEVEAREYLKSVMYKTWKKMNEATYNCSFSQCFISTTVNLTNMALCMYQRGDGHTIQDPEIKSRILSLVIKPIPLTYTKK
ncbi:terpene synthase 10-like [Lotus japonicus]|uniref:terpene synthase 10-like n=1 Tax=Lotus japonicus TaxID=34305 RepID=UPI0025898184|nr:terpene synthase 10-like [Lotus japonicus]